jgi:hypothetical protein
MIEDKETGMKLAETKVEALEKKTIEKIKENILNLNFQIELEQVILKHLEGKAKV